ncbi:hypothetical protein KJ966_25175 [bacterium]|nr:hypothetical protein [bacterium]
MEYNRPVYYDEIERCVDAIFERVGKDVVLGTPLALGKPNQLINEIYKRVKEDPTISLKIITALSLERPTASSELERRIMEPLVERIFADFPDFEYLKDLRKNQLPQNFELIEFYNKSGGFLNAPHAQQNYISSNYTHVSRDIFSLGINVAAQLLAKDTIDGKPVYSMSCNPDTPIEVGEGMLKQAEAGTKNFIVGQINNNLPFMYGDAIIEGNQFDAIIDNPKYDFTLFAPPKVSVATDDYMIGLHASTLIQDGGTLQIGIGSLGDAICAGLQMRQDNNDVYNESIRDFGIQDSFGDVIEQWGGTDRFEEGLYGSSEMLVDGFIHLYKSGIIKRKVYDSIPIQKLLNNKKITETVTPQMLSALMEHQAIEGRLTENNFEFLKHYGILKEGLTYRDGEIINGSRSYSADLCDETAFEKVTAECLGKELKHGVVMHGAFFIGPKAFYDALNDMPEEERRLFNMTSVKYVNQLYGGEEIKTLQRRKARFINAGMKVNLLGAVASDALEDGRVVSGVGGQYNFVCMAHELKDARGILMIKSTRTKEGKVSSNVVFNYGHTTIPRHLRDMVVTEYGIADIKGQTDSTVIARILNVTDSRFQEGLLREAKKHKKIATNHTIPERFRNNTPTKLEKMIAPYKKKGYFDPFPLGKDLTDEEIVLIGSLRKFKNDLARKKVSLGKVGRTITSIPPETIPYLQRMELDKPATLKEKMLQKTVVYALLNGGKL